MVDGNLVDADRILKRLQVFVAEDAEEMVERIVDGYKRCASNFEVIQRAEDKEELNSREGAHFAALIHMYIRQRAEDKRDDEETEEG